MASEGRGGGGNFTPEQEACCAEWQTLCQTLERAQGEELSQNCRDRYQFAKTYMVFGRDVKATIEDVRHRLSHGKLTFFSDRGIFTECVTLKVAERMLRDWKRAVEAKKQHAAIVFQSKFGASIDDYVGDSPMSVMHTTKMAGAKCLFEADAILLMDALPSAPPPTASPELEELVLLRTEVERLRVDVDRILAKLEIE